jgi:hypothetical protein
MLYTPSADWATGPGYPNPRQSEEQMKTPQGGLQNLDLAQGKNLLHYLLIPSAGAKLIPKQLGRSAESVN